MRLDVYFVNLPRVFGIGYVGYFDTFCIKSQYGEKANYILEIHIILYSINIIFESLTFEN